MTGLSLQAPSFKTASPAASFGYLCKGAAFGSLTASTGFKRVEQTKLFGLCLFRAVRHQADVEELVPMEAD